MGTYTLRKIIRKLPGLVIKLVPIPEPAIVEGCGARGRTCDIIEQGRKAALKVGTVLTKMINLDSINYSAPVTFTNAQIAQILQKI